jgi:hypothetical protein
MSIYIDRKFLHLVSPKLERFAQKKPDLYNFRCPICGDSQKNKSKARGFVYKKSNDYFFRCHNCGASHTFYNFLKFVDPSLLKEYTYERFTNGETGNHNYPKPTFEEFKSQPAFNEKATQKKIELDTIESLPESHYAKAYVKARKIPEKYFSELYFAPDFKMLVQSLGVENENLKEEDPRLIIPFYDENNELFAIQGRALSESKIRYITITLVEDELFSGYMKFYGLNKLDRSKKVYVVEGPIDSMFLPNAIATADADLTRAAKLELTDFVLVYDNEPRNKDIVKQIGKAIASGYNVTLLPENIKQKDINDMILAGISPGEILDLIDKFTFSNLRANLEFSNWKKV